MDKELKNEPTEFDVTYFFKALLKTRYIAVIAASLSILFFLVFLMFSVWKTPVTTVYKQLFQLTFLAKNKKQTASYPNGKLFSLTDLTSSGVLRSVYQLNDLKKYNIKLNVFLNAFRAEPYDSARELIVSRYRKRLSSRKLTFIEKKTIENEMSEEIDNIRQDQVVLIFNTFKDYGMTDDIVKKIMQDIMEGWAQFQIKKQGVLNFPQTMSEKSIIDPSIIDINMPYVSTSYIIDIINIIRKKIADLITIDGIKTIIDDETKFSIGDLPRALSHIENFTLRIFLVNLTRKNLEHKDLEKKVLLARINMINTKYNTLLEQADFIKDKLRQYDGQENTIVSNKNTPSVSNIDRSTTQLNEGVLNSIIKLAKKRNEDVQYRQKLIEAQINILRNASRIKNIRKHNEIILNFSNTSVENQNISVDKFSPTNTLKNIFNDLEKYWSILDRITKQLRNKKLSYSGDLYKRLNLERKKFKKTSHPILNARIFLLLLLTILGSMSMAILGHLLWQLIHQKKSNAL